MTLPKPTKIRSKRIRASAKGQACTLHTPYCNANPETVVLCHAPSPSKGTGTKSDDTWAAYGCSGCHHFLDQVADYDVAIGYWMKGIPRTQNILYQQGLIEVK